MSSTKHTEGLGMLVKVETTYGTDAAPASTDAVRFVKPRPDIAIRHAFDGAVGIQNGGYGVHMRIAPNGRNSTLTIRMHAKGRGAAYTSSSVEVPDIHRLLRACGFAAANTATGGSEKWDFTPTTATGTPASVTIWVYTRGELLKFTGGYGSVKITAEGIGIPVWEFTFVGIMAQAVTDVTLPSLTYTVPTVVPVAASGVTLAFANLTTPKLRSMTFDLGRTYDQMRQDQIAAGGLAGFQPGPREPTIELLVETSALQGSPYTATSAFEPYLLVANATSGAFSYTCGSVQYYRWKLISAQAQVIGEPELVDEGNVALSRLRLRPYVVGDQDASDLTLRFD